MLNVNLSIYHHGTALLICDFQSQFLNPNKLHLQIVRIYVAPSNHRYRVAKVEGPLIFGGGVKDISTSPDFEIKNNNHWRIEGGQGPSISIIYIINIQKCYKYAHF